MGDKREWLKSEIDQIINMYHNQPELWDVKSKIYKDRVKKRDALKEIAKKFGTTVEEITRNIHNLRNQFNSEFKKTNKRKSGQGTDEVYTSKWPYFKSLLFLQSGLICRSPTGNLAMGDVAEEYESENVTQCSSENVSLEQFGVNTVDNIKSVNQETPQNSRKKKKNNDLTESDLIMQKALNVLNEKEDQYDVFGTYVASELRNLSSEYLRKKLKRKFQQAILEISDEEERLTSVSSAYSNPNSVASYSRHTYISIHSEQIRQDSLPQTASQYLHTETESCYENL